MPKDWTGNYNSIYVALGASNHSDKDREVNDYYATDPKAVEQLLAVEDFNENIWECACGQGHISEVLKDHGHNVRSTDLIYRGYGEEEEVDFLKTDVKNFDGDIITNPPYKYCKEFVEKSIDVVSDGNKVAMLLKLTFLESARRRPLFDKYPPKYVYVFSKRTICAMNGRFDVYTSSAVAYAWFVLEKGFNGEPTIRWI